MLAAGMSLGDERRSAPVPHAASPEARMGKILDAAALEQYQSLGYDHPIDVLSAQEVAGVRANESRAHS